MKIKVSLFLTLILLIIPVLAKAQEPAWLFRLKNQKWMDKVNQIKLLKTSRAEVENILGKSDETDSQTDHSDETFTIENGKVRIYYTTEQCTSTDGKIEKNIVTEIDFEIKETVSFPKLAAKLQIPLKRFNHTSTDVAEYEIYENAKDGVNISTYQKRLSSIGFSIPEYKNFNCVSLPILLNDLDKIKKIELLKSNRDYVRQIFADYKLLNGIQSKYKDEFYGNSTSFEFTYSEGNCEFEEADGYNTSEWNVEHIKISPFYDFAPKEIGIDLTQYRKEKIHQNISGVYVFHDKQKGIRFKIDHGKLDELEIFPQQRFNSLMCNQKKAKILSATKSIFSERLKDRIYGEEFAYVKNLSLSQKEIILDCNISDISKNKVCSQNNQIVKIYTTVQNSKNEDLSYNFTVSGGKVTSQGPKVWWDLSGVKAGTYTITAAVDDGCGFCGKTITKTVVVKECSDCKNK